MRVESFCHLIFSLLTGDSAKVGPCLVASRGSYLSVDQLAVLSTAIYTRLIVHFYCGGSSVSPFFSLDPQFGHGGDILEARRCERARSRICIGRGHSAYFLVSAGLSFVWGSLTFHLVVFPRKILLRAGSCVREFRRLSEFSITSACQLVS